MGVGVYGGKDLRKTYVLACTGRVKELWMTKVAMVNEMKND